MGRLPEAVPPPYPPMLATPRIRIGQRAGSFESTYTLGGTEAFRLDTASWAHSVADDSDQCQPLLRCADADGAVFAEVTTPAFSAGSTPAPFGFEYDGPAVLFDDDSFFMPNAYQGYVFHDFGAVPVTVAGVVSWSQPPGLAAATGATWFRSPGAISMGASIAAGTVVDSSTITLTLAGPAPAGSYLIIACSLLDTSRFAFTAPKTAVTVTDTVGGNALVFGGILTIGVGVTSVRAATGISAEGFFDLYKINNPLAAGDKLTITLADSTIAWFSCHVHVVTGMAAVNPIGPNPGSSNVGEGGGSNTSPITLDGGPFLPDPTWVGGVLMGGVYVTRSTHAVDVMLDRGGVTQTTTNITATLPARGYTQAALPELHLGPGDTLTALAVNSSGDVRAGDVVSDFLIWGVDD